MTQSKTYLACASLLGILLTGPINSTEAADITVCLSGCNHTTIQAGIDAAAGGDTVLVGPETYYENITMKAGVSVVSEGPNTYIPYTDPFGGTVTNEEQVLKRATWTILHGLGDAPVVSFPAGANNAVLDGFVIEHIDTAVNTALIKVVDCSPTIKNNIMSVNQSAGQNGGIAVVSETVVATPLIQDNVIHYRLEN